MKSCTVITTALAALALATLALAAPATLAGQEGQAVGVRLLARAGAMTPADWFYEEYLRLGVPPLQWTEAAIEKTAVVTLTAEVALEGLGLWVRGEVVRTVGGETRLVHGVLHQTTGVDQPSTDRSDPYYVPSTLTISSVDVGLPTRFVLPFGIQPYVTAGIGGKHYAFDLTGVQDAEHELVLPEEGTTFVINGGVGFTARVFGVRLDFLARDAVSEYWGDQQHDVLFLAGLFWTVF